MAKILPDYGSRLEQEVKSAAERRVYQALKDGLTEDFTILHSVAWLAHQPGEHAQDGEADFMLMHPQYGILVIEVKGGGISCDGRSGQWFSCDAQGARHEIKNPFAQAKNAKHQILAVLRRHKDWDKSITGPICIGHAVWFPDITSTDSLIGPDRPNELILSSLNLAQVQQSIEIVWKFVGAISMSRVELGKKGVELAERQFARTFTVLPTASARIEDEERQRIELTTQQFRILKMLGARRRVGIAGGAGTGKTLIALEKAHELAKRGFKTLLLAYNRPLGDHLAPVVNPALPITASGFHAFAEKFFKQYGESYVTRAKKDFPGADHWNVIVPAALYYIAEENGDVRFDAILVDEAQDFADEFWLPLESMMSDMEKTPLYFFYDANQRIYRRSQDFPIKPEEEFTLTENCRNTVAIHEVVRPLFAGGELNPPSISGVPVAWHAAETLPDQAKCIRSLILSLTGEAGGLSAGDIVVLVANRRTIHQYLAILQHTPLPGGLHFEESANPSPKQIRVLTAAKFKGLEAPVVIVTGVDGLEPDHDEARMDLYVAFSRPKNELHVVATSASINLNKTLQNTTQP